MRAWMKVASLFSEERELPDDKSDGHHGHHVCFGRCVPPRPRKAPAHAIHPASSHESPRRSKIQAHHVHHVIHAAEYLY